VAFIQRQIAKDVQSDSSDMQSVHDFNVTVHAEGL